MDYILVDIDWLELFLPRSNELLCGAIKPNLAAVEPYSLVSSVSSNPAYVTCHSWSSGRSAMTTP
jgi:hypothetical protein